MDLYEGTTNYKTILHIKEQIWNFVEQSPSDDWVKGKFALDLEKLTLNKEGLKFFKTERFMHFIREKSNTYTIVDFSVQNRVYNSLILSLIKERNYIKRGKNYDKSSYAGSRRDIIR
ncbi:MAG: hypothetical protein B6227_00375 [Fusobacteriia bacterium 4572_74]|nr:MAG: hypothetical protein B6227_00375 [Fusobacteriia bacterium 4572_74]